MGSNYQEGVRDFVNNERRTRKCRGEKREERTEEVLTSDAKCDLVTPLAVGILETAVQAIAAHVHFHEDKSWAFLPPLGLHICPIHLPRD